MRAATPEHRIAIRPPVWRKWRAFIAHARRMTIASFTDTLADVYGERAAFILDRPIESAVFSGSVVSYRDLQRLVCRAANALAALGVRRGDRVALATANRIELVFVELGAQRLGAVPVPLNFMLTVDEIRDLVERSGARVLVTDRVVYERNIRDRAEVPSIDRWVMVTTQRVPDGFESLDTLMARASDSHVPADVRDDDPALIFFTAGTTGQPKGALLTSGGLMASFRRYAAVAAVRPTPTRDLALAVMPLAHTGGHQQLMVHLALAIPSYVMGSFDPERILDTIEAQRITMFAGLPSMFRMLLDAGAAERDLRSVRVWGGGGDAFPRELIARFRSLSPRSLFITGYGLAETAGQVSIAPGFGAGDACVGWFLPGVDWRLLGADGRDVARGEPGELVLRTPGLMREYYGDPEATGAAIKDGWFHTGDLLRRGRWGMMYFVAREKEMIKVGGYSVFPAEVEKALEAHPDVERCVIVGLPHRTKGELPVAAVVRRDGSDLSEEALLAWAEARIAAYRCPRRVELVDELPMSFALKPLRSKVRAMLLAKGVTVQARSERMKSASLTE